MNDKSAANKDGRVSVMKSVWVALMTTMAMAGCEGEERNSLGYYDVIVPTQEQANSQAEAAGNAILDGLLEGETDPRVLDAEAYAATQEALERGGGGGGGGGDD